MAEPALEPVASLETPLDRHLSRLEASYQELFAAADIQRHVEAVESLSAERLAVVLVDETTSRAAKLTVVGYDFFAELSVICGLLSAHGLSIQAGRAYTYAAAKQGADNGKTPARRPRRRPPRVRPSSGPRLPERKIVDWFIVHHEEGVVDWQAFEADLHTALELLATGNLAGARGLVATRVADRLREHQVAGSGALATVEVTIDNELEEPFTRLEVRAPDSIAFLYELCNAFSLCEVNIERLEILTREDHVHDVLHVTQARGGKITSERKLAELRAAALLIKQFTHLLPQAPDPRAALLHFGELVARMLSREDWLDKLSVLEQPEVTRRLARVLGVSHFLWEDFLRSQPDQLMPLLSDATLLEEAKSVDQLREELETALAAASEKEDRRNALNDFKDREMFRIDMRHVLGHTQFWRFADELTELGEVVLLALTEGAYADLVQRYGEPQLESGAPCGHCVCALGKFGGREMGFGSDVELMFLYEGGGRATRDGEETSNSEFYERWVRQALQSLKVPREGIFEPDLRLRPHGSKGPLAVSLEAFRRYFGPEGSAHQYERQALIKLRPIAGSTRLFDRILALRDECVYSGWVFNVAKMRDLRRRQQKELVKPGQLNAKFSAGGLVDIEYTVQALQIRHGTNDPRMRTVSTRKTIAALRDTGHLDVGAATQLSEAYAFHRQLIDGLRVVRGNAKDLTVPPEDSEEFLLLCRRLGCTSTADRDQLVVALHNHLETVQRLSRDLLGNGA